MSQELPRARAGRRRDTGAADEPASRTPRRSAGPAFWRPMDLIARHLERGHHRARPGGGIPARGDRRALPRPWARGYSRRTWATPSATSTGSWSRTTRQRTAARSAPREVRRDDPGRPWPYVVIPAFDLDSGVVTGEGVRSWKAKFFQNFESDPGDRDELVVDVAMRTSAAPTFFPMYQGYVDGGVVANNPSMCALAQALDPRAAAARQVADVTLLSVGTGLNPHYVQRLRPRLGPAPVGAQPRRDHARRRRGRGRLPVPPDPGRSLSPARRVLAEDIGLDAVDRIPALEQVADATPIDGAVAWARAQLPPRVA